MDAMLHSCDLVLISMWRQRRSPKVSKLLTRLLTETVCKPETLRVLELNVPKGTLNRSLVSGCPGLESGSETGRELADGAQTLEKEA